MSELNPIIIITGPTASGKSSLAIDLAQSFGGNVINADSMQVYKELRILTARPSSKEEALVPHRLFGEFAAEDRCSVGRWLDLAIDEIKDAWGAERLAIVVGGTGMYLKSLRYGLATVPEIPNKINKHVRTLYTKLGGKSFVEELARVDPRAASVLHVSDSQRLTRAMAVVLATGMTLDVWQAKQIKGSGFAARFFIISFLPDRKALYFACEKRFDAMLKEGAVAEVENLLALGLDPSLPAMKAVGVSEIANYIAGKTTLENATLAAKQSTRNLAKRQLTWLRNQVKSDYVVEGFYDPNQRGEVVKAVADFII